MQLFRTKKNMQREKTTCLSQHKATLMLFRSCSLETLDPRDFETSARPSTRSKHRAQHAKQQTSTTKNNAPIKKGLKREPGSVLGTQTQETLRTELSLNRYIYREICIITHKDYMLDIF
jgi:hypothetical protein